MKLLLLPILAAISLSFAQHEETEPNCTPGDKWADGKIKMECTHDRIKPIACLPYGEVGKEELLPGQEWSNKNFKFQCKSTGDLSMSFDVVGCLLPSGAALAVGSESGVANKGIYKCVRNADNTISRKYSAGCYFNNNLYSPGQPFNFGKGQITCVSANGFFEAKASGCLLEDNQVVELGACIEKKKEYFKCAANAQFAWQAEFIKISEVAYIEWVKGTLQEEEESAGGDQGSGQTRRTTTTPRPTTQAPTQPPTPPPTPPPTEAPVTATTARYDPPATTTRPQPQCYDVHPICESLCNRRCSNEPSVGLASINNRSNKQKGLVSQIVGAKLNLGANEINRNGGGYGGGGYGNGGYGGGGGWGQWGGGGGWNQWGNSGGYGNWGQWGNQGNHGNQGGRPGNQGGHQGGQQGQGGKPGGSGQGGWQGNDKPGKPGHGHGQGNGNQGNQGTQGPDVRPPQHNGQCFNLADTGFELIAALCPRSCGACEQNINLQEVAAKWGVATCAIRDQPGPSIGLPQEPSVGLAVEPPAPQPKPPQNDKQNGRGRGRNNG